MRLLFRFFVFLLFLSFLLNNAQSIASLRSRKLLTTVPAPPPSLSFSFLGDWGYTGYNQSLVAQSMAVWSMKNNASFVIALGDNFYMQGVANDTDPLWKSIYQDVYNQEPLTSVPWYAILGNHDYRLNPEAQIDYTRNKRDDRWTMPGHGFHAIYTVPTSTSSISTGGLVSPENIAVLREKMEDTAHIEIIFIDTLLLAPFEAPETTPTGKYGVSDKATQEHLQWIEKTLAASKATWLIVAGHYPIYSMAEHGDTGDLISKLDPLLRKYRVNAYINGHDHVLQHMSWRGVEYFTCGHGTLTDSFPLGYFPYQDPGRAKREGHTETNISLAYEGYRFGTIGPGFGGAKVTKNTLTISYYDRNGKELYSMKLTNPREATATTSDSTKSHFHTKWIILIAVGGALLLVIVMFIARKRGVTIGSICHNIRAIFKGGNGGRGQERSTHEMEIGGISSHQLSISLSSNDDSGLLSGVKYGPITSHTDAR